MSPNAASLLLARRRFFTSTASGLGGAALAWLLPQDCLAGDVMSASSNPFSSNSPHFAPRAKRFIFIFLDGGPSQMDLFDPKPKLHELHGQTLPESMLENVRFAFINKQAKLKASPQNFQKHGQ